MRCISKLAALLLLTASCFSADLAILRNGFTIRHERREVIGTTTRLYISDDPSSFVDVPTADIESFEKDYSLPPPVQPKPPAEIKTNRSVTEIINSAGSQYKLDPDFIDSVISAESGHNARAVSPKGAQGLMQLMPQTANQLGVRDPFHPESNVDGGTRYLRGLLEKYNFDVAKALAAYNAGPHRVEQYRGVPPYRETRLYVNRIIRDYNRKRLAQQKQQRNAAAAPPQATKPPVKHPGSVKTQE